MHLNDGTITELQRYAEGSAVLGGLGLWSAAATRWVKGVESSPDEVWRQQQIAAAKRFERTNRHRFSFPLTAK